MYVPRRRSVRLFLGYILLVCVVVYILRVNHGTNLQHRITVNVVDRGNVQTALWGMLLPSGQQNNVATANETLKVPTSSTRSNKSSHIKGMNSTLKPIHYFDTLTLDAIVNPYNFQYILNNQTLCRSTQNLTYLIIVHSAPGNRQRRLGFRQTWAQPDLFSQFPSRLAFFLARFKDSGRVKQAEIRDESEQYGDIIQADFMDSYKNLTYKAMLSMKWISDYCQNVKYIFKSDDDVYVNMPLLLRRLTTEFSNRHRFIMGLIWTYPSLHVQRPGKLCQRWCTPYDVLPGMVHYPTFAAGAFYIMSRDLAPEIFNMSTRTPFYWVDDAYMTGIVAKRIRNLTHISITRSYKFNQNKFLRAMNTSKPSNLIVTLTRNPKRIWEEQLKKMATRDIQILGEKRHHSLLDKLNVTALHSNLN